MLRILGGVAFAGLLAALAVIRHPDSSIGQPVRGGFGRRYWLVVAGEVAAIVAGSAVLSGPLDAPRAVVAWVSVVVGAHFLALAAVWREDLFRLLGVAITLCGVAGLIAAGVEASDGVIAAVGGVVPGALLLAAGYWGAFRGRRTKPGG